MKTIDKNLLQKVITALQINEQQYTELIYDAGKAYLAAFIHGYPQVVKQIISSKTFWDWWKSHWEKREMEFIETITEYPDAVPDIKALHMDIHNPETLASGIYLNGIVLKESYLSLIEKITKEQTESKTTATWVM